MDDRELGYFIQKQDKISKFLLELEGYGIDDETLEIYDLGNEAEQETEEEISNDDFEKGIRLNTRKAEEDD